MLIFMQFIQDAVPFPTHEFLYRKRYPELQAYEIQ
jgi:hypothetical protein